MSDSVLMTQDLNARSLLNLWEHGIQASGLARGDALLAASAAPLPRTLGERNRRLLELHEHLFGGTLDLVSQCPGCGTAAQFAATCRSLLADMLPSTAGEPPAIEHGGYRVTFRLPDAADVVASACEAETQGFVRRLVSRLVLSCSLHGVEFNADLDADCLPDAVVDRLSRRIEQLDPGARVSFTVACPDCAKSWDAALDVGEMLWMRLQVAAERLLLDVDALARAYGWSEAQVLALPPLRRAAYLQMVSA